MTIANSVLMICTENDEIKVQNCAYYTCNCSDRALRCPIRQPHGDIWHLKYGRCAVNIKYTPDF